MARLSIPLRFIKRNFWYIRTFIISIVKFVFYCFFFIILGLYMAVVYFIVPLGPVFFAILSLFGLTYTLISGFVYFTTRNNFGRYTDISQRFWKRSFGLFWLIEVGLFGCVLYLCLISPSEVGYAYDLPAAFKTHFFAFEDFFIRMIIFNILLLLLQTMLAFNYRIRITNWWLLHFSITVVFLLLIYIEIGIFQNYMCAIGFYKWAVSLESVETMLENEVARNRALNAFVLFIAITKFWHFILVSIIWFFYLGRYFEYAETREALLNAIIQSFLILYSLNFLQILPHIKFVARKYMCNPYYWFFETPNFKSLLVAWQFTKLLYSCN